MRYCLTTVKLVIYQKVKDNKCWENVEKRESLYILGGNINWCSNYGKQYEGSSKFKGRTTIRFSNPTAGYISKGNKISMSRRYLHSQIHCHLCTISKVGKQSKCPLVCKWIRKICYIYIYNRILFCIINKKITVLSDNTDEPEIYILSEIRQTQTNTVRYHLYAENERVKLMEIVEWQLQETGR